MARTAQQEGLGDAFLLAIAGAAGCAVSLRRPDDDSIDWTLSCRLPLRPKIDVQMKTYTSDDGNGEHIRYPLKKKNYDDLIIGEFFVPRILVLILLPQDIEGWVALSSEQLTMKKCGYWMSLHGMPASDNETTVTVSVPRSNVLTVEALCGMMWRVNEGGAL
jgi:hypothetical protein